MSNNQEVVRSIGETNRIIGVLKDRYIQREAKKEKRYAILDSRVELSDNNLEQYA